VPGGSTPAHPPPPNGAPRRGGFWTLTCINRLRDPGMIPSRCEHKHNM
jgi:hypothetical protein